jgi:Na+-driven multidrug efflux pump
MLGMGGATRYAIARSRSDPEDGNRIFTGTLWLAAGFSVLFVLAGAFLSGPLARLTGADPEVFEMTRIISGDPVVSPAFMLNDIMVCFVRNDGEPRLAMTGMLTGSLANILMDYMLIFPLGLGILGAVLATGFAPLISCW